MRTYGRLWYEDGKWCFDVEPHVAVVLKRLFPKLSPAAKSLVLSETPGSARDVEWVLQRFPLEMSEETAAYVKGKADASREEDRLMHEFLSGVRTPRPFELAIPARHYQRVAAEIWLSRRGLLLADDLGVGKTATAIAGLTEPSTRPALVVTATHLVRQWERELARFAPNLTTAVLKKGSVYDLTKRARTRARSNQLSIAGVNPFPDVIISNYHKLPGWTEHLRPVINSVIFDEVQELRNGVSTQKGASAFRLAETAKYRLGLSATPIYNYGNEIFPIIELLTPGALGSRSEFLQEWCTAPDNRDRASIKDPKAFGSFAREQGLMLRRTKSDVGLEMPQVVRVVQEIDCDAAPLKEIEGAAQRLAEVILTNTETRRGERMEASAELSAMVRHATGVAKAPYVAELVRMLAEDEKVVLFGWHHTVYGIWMERLAPLNPVLFTGEQSASQKDAAREAFVSGNSRVLIMSLRSGAGLDGLQFASRVAVFGELDWSPGVIEQCIGRIDRPGQLSHVTAFFPVSDGGSDPSMTDVLQLKRYQVEGIRNPTTDIVENLEVDGERIKNLARQYLARKSA